MKLHPYRKLPHTGFFAKTLEEIALELGCTPQAVRHSEKRALAKLRDAFVERKIVTREGRYER